MGWRSVWPAALMAVSVVSALGVVACAADPGVGSGGSSGASGTGGGAAVGGAGGVSGVGGQGGSGGVSGVGGTGGDSGQGGIGGDSGVGGSAGDAGQDGCTSTGADSPVTLGAVDIIWIIDASGSMWDELAAVQANIAAFANDISNAGVDHHVIMITGFADPVANTALAGSPQYLYVNQDVDSHNALSILVSAYGSYSHFLRPGAPKHFVVITDDESSPLTAAQFKPMMEAQLGQSFYFHSIASESVNGGACIGACGIPFVCSASSPGLQYYALSDMTMGLKVSICIADWSQVFNPLKDAVVESVPLPCTFTIPPPPPGKEFDKDRVNFEYTPPNAAPMAWPRASQVSDCGTQIGWHYDNFDAPTTIQLCPAGCDAVSGGGRINIIFGCEEPPVLIPD